MGFLEPDERRGRRDGQAHLNLTDGKVRRRCNAAPFSLGAVMEMLHRGVMSGAHGSTTQTAVVMR
jgi:hypothetical protein